MSIQEIIRKNLFYYRTINNKTYEDLETETGTSAVTWEEAETETSSDIDLGLLCQFCHQLNLTMDSLVDITPSTIMTVQTVYELVQEGVSVKQLKAFKEYFLMIQLAYEKSLVKEDVTKQTQEVPIERIVIEEVEDEEETY